MVVVNIISDRRETNFETDGQFMTNKSGTHQQDNYLSFSSHLEQCSLINPKFSIFPFYKFHTNDVSARLSKEKYFIKIFNPKLNGPGVSLTLCCFVVYSTRRFFVCLTMCHFVLVFFSPFSIAITSLGEERANLSAFRTFVRFVLVWICRFPLNLHVWEGLRFVIAALPGLFSHLFF